MPIPNWSPGLIQRVAATTGLATFEGRWNFGTLSGVDLGILALAAVLRNSTPAPRDFVEHAVAFTVIPRGLDQHLLKLGLADFQAWRRATCSDGAAKELDTAETMPWDRVLRISIIQCLLEVDAETDAWRAGTDINDAPSRELDARAQVALSWLAHSRGAK